MLSFSTLFFTFLHWLFQIKRNNACYHQGGNDALLCSRRKRLRKSQLASAGRAESQESTSPPCNFRESLQNGGCDICFGEGAKPIKSESRRPTASCGHYRKFYSSSMSVHFENRDGNGIQFWRMQSVSALHMAFNTFIG